MVVVAALVTAGGCRSSAAPALSLGAPAQDYSVTYRVDEGGRVTTERVRVHRPFASDVTLPGSVRVGDLGRLATRSDGPWTVLEVPPAPAARDLRPDIALADGQRRHLLQLRGRETVAGRRCQVYRSGRSVDAGVLATSRPGTRTYTDFCVARGSVVLHTHEVTDGKVTRDARATAFTTRAVDVQPIPSVATVAVDAGGGRTTRIDASTRPPFDRFYALDTTPAGFTPVGRFAVVPPGLAGTTSLVAEVYVRGTDYLQIDQGASRDGSVPFDTGRPSSAVDVAGLGRAEVVLDLRANEVRVVLPDGGFLRVVGTLVPQELVHIAENLRQQP